MAKNTVYLKLKLNYGLVVPVQISIDYFLNLFSQTFKFNIYSYYILQNSIGSGLTIEVSLLSVLMPN